MEHLYLKRITSIKALLHQQHVDAVLLSSVPSIIYLTGYAGFSIEEREAWILITPDHQYLFTDGRYITAVEEHTHHLEIVEISSRDPFKQALTSILQQEQITILGIEEQNMNVHEFKMITPLVKELKHFSYSQLRIKKTQEEIQCIESACALGDKAFEHGMLFIRPGITERQLAWEIEKFIKEHHAEVSFRTIVAFDEHAAVPHHQTGDRKLGRQGVVLIDMGVKIDNYCSDMTRTVFLGKATTEQKKVYETVLNAQQSAIQTISHKLSAINSEKNPLHASDIDQAAREYIIQAGYPSIPHSLGHGIGLEVHESPSLSPISKNTLGDGMVFSIEPGIYLPGKFGVRIEDVCVMENMHLRQLTRSPKHLTQIES